MNYVKQLRNEQRTKQMIKQSFDSCNKTLDLSCKDINGNDFIDFCHSFTDWKQIHAANLDQNDLNESCMRALVDKPINNIKQLYLSKNIINLKAIEWLTKLRLSQLKILHLNQNFIGDQGTKMLTKSNWKNLTHLKLNDNGITHIGAQSIAINGWVSLTYLNFDKNKIGRSSLLHFQACSNNRKLKILVLYIYDSNNYLQQKKKTKQTNEKWHKIMHNINYRQLHIQF